MEAARRRKDILQYLCAQHNIAVSATAIAERMGVSRQVIVGDIALLRAQGYDILATARGYKIPNEGQKRFLGKIACRHTMDGLERELLTVIEHGGEVIDESIEHELYGEVTGKLNIATLDDVRAFLRKARNRDAIMLSDLSGGVHVHTIACRDSTVFNAICASLERHMLLYK